MNIRNRSLLFISASFFVWGILRALNDTLVAAYEAYRPFHDAQAMLVHFSFFTSYLILPLPASLFIRRRGLRFGLVAAALVMAAGALGCAVSLENRTWALGLVSLFFVAAGIALLQTAASPSVALLGNREGAPQRLLLAQSAVSLGAALAPYAALWTGLPSSLAHYPGNFLDLSPIYYVCGALLVATAVALSGIRGGVLASHEVMTTANLRRVMSSSLLFGVVSVFLGVGAETTVLTHIVLYERRFGSAYSVTVLGTGLLSTYWLMGMVGRLLSFLILKRLQPVALLRVAAGMAAALVCVALCLRDHAGSLALVSTGLACAVVFPLVFSLCTEGLGAAQMATASGLLMTAISGGAMIPVLSGLLADRLGVCAAFLLPLACYLWITATAGRCQHPIPVCPALAAGQLSTGSA